MAFPYVSDIINAIFGTHWYVPVPVFGFCLAVTIFTATWVFRREADRLEALGALPRSTQAAIADLVLLATLSGIVGARVFHLLDYPAAFMNDPGDMIFSRSGFSIYGGFAFGIAAAIVFLRRRSIPIRPMLDAAAPAMMLGYAMGRFGCQLSGDGDWGVIADIAAKPAWLSSRLWAQTYDNNVIGAVIAPPGVYPTPLYESIVALVLYLLLCTQRSHKHAFGYVFSVYLLFAGFERLLIEKIRTNVRYDFLNIALTQAEIVSYLIIVAGLGGLLATMRTRRLATKLFVSFFVLSALSACAPL